MPYQPEILREARRPWLFRILLKITSSVAELVKLGIQQNSWPDPMNRPILNGTVKRIIPWCLAKIKGKGESLGE